MSSEGETTIHPKLQEALIRVKFSFVDVITREWVKIAISEGAHLREPNNLTARTWIRDRNILGVALLSQANNRQIGMMYGITGEGIRQIINKTSFTIWGSCSDETREKFPYGEIPFDRSSRNRNPENMLLQDNLGSRIVGLLESGLTAAGVRSELSNVFPPRLHKNLRLLVKLGFEVPGLRRNKAENRRILAGLQNTNLSDEQIQALLDKARIELYRLGIKGGEITSVKDLLKQADFHYQTDWIDLFYQAIEQVGIPLGVVNNIYNFIASQHLQRAVDLLKSNPDLKRFLENPVKQVAGSEVPLPTTTKLEKPEEFGRCGRIFQECGMSNQHFSKMNIDEFFQGCPVPIFRHDSPQRVVYIYPISQKGALTEFIRSKLNLDSALER